MPGRPLFSVCIPAYNRSKFLAALLQSILDQGFDDCEIVVCEDHSPQRSEIRDICSRVEAETGRPVRYFENTSNLGFDGNVRRLVELARGRYCFFMGNDDLLAPEALERAAASLQRFPDTGVLLRAYSWFTAAPDVVAGTVRYAATETRLQTGAEAIGMCFRRSGVISGYIVDRDLAAAAATAQFDGTLYYQMHLTASVLMQRPALVVPDVLVYCRDSEVPEFGAARSEQGLFTPGRYTPQARVNLVKGAFRILAAHDELEAGGVRQRILRDYARHFYPYVRDQLYLPPRAYLAMCRLYAATEVGRFPSFYINCVLAYLLGQRAADGLLRFLRNRLGHSPRLS